MNAKLKRDNEWDRHTDFLQSLFSWEVKMIVLFRSYLQSIADSRLAQTYDPASKVNASSRKKNKKQVWPLYFNLFQFLREIIDVRFDDPLID